MKEVHLFYAPDIENRAALSEDDAAHAVRVLRIREGERLWATDGCGHFYEGTASPGGSGKHPECYINIERTEEWQRPWPSEIHVAVAPTKN